MAEQSGTLDDRDGPNAMGRDFEVTLWCDGTLDVVGITENVARDLIGAAVCDRCDGTDLEDDAFRCRESETWTCSRCYAQTEHAALTMGGGS